MKMRYMMLVKHPEKFSGPPPKALMNAINKLTAENAGAMVAGGALAPEAVSTRVRITRGDLKTTDGPYSESKEVIGGFAIFDFKSKQAAIESAQQFMDLHRIHWPGWEGETEIRQILGPEDFAPRA
jgi:hypothetical protein